MQNHHLDKEFDDILKIFQNTKKDIKINLKNYCFDKHAADHSKFIDCLDEKYKFLDIYQKNFLLKYDFEKLNLYNCLNPKGNADIVPDICLNDFENHVYKHMKDFSNILK